MLVKNIFVIAAVISLAATIPGMAASSIDCSRVLTPSNYWAILATVTTIEFDCYCIKNNIHTTELVIDPENPFPTCCGDDPPEGFGCWTRKVFITHHPCLEIVEDKLNQTDQHGQPIHGGDDHPIWAIYWKCSCVPIGAGGFEISRICSFYGEPIFSEERFASYWPCIPCPY